jgi:hypothetical protein
MRKSDKRELLATTLGMIGWEQSLGIGPTEAAEKLQIPLRTYFRWRTQGMPKKLQREVVLDRMCAILAVKKHGKA